MCLLKQVSNNLGATRHMLNDRMLFLNINADPGATSKQKSFANDILRNEFAPEVQDHGGSAETHMYFKLYEEHCLNATLGASTKAQANMYLAAGSYGNGGGAGSNNVAAAPPQTPWTASPWTSHNLRKGAASAAYAIKVHLNGIRYAGAGLQGPQSWSPSTWTSPCGRRRPPSCSLAS